MEKILIKTLFLHGEHWNQDILKPIQWDAEQTYRQVDKFLKNKGKPLMDEIIRKRITYLPHIDYPFETKDTKLAVSGYLINNCLVRNLFYSCGIYANTAKNCIHKIRVGSKIDNLSDIEKTICMLKAQNTEYLPYWEPEDDKLITLPGKLDIESIAEAWPYMNKLPIKQPGP